MKHALNGKRVAALATDVCIDELQDGRYVGQYA
jgi:hypothetical protein